MPTRGRFPPGLRVPAHKPRRPSVLRLPRYLSRRGAIKPLGGQRRARDTRLGNLVGDPGGIDSAAVLQPRVDRHQDWGHLLTAGKFQSGSGMLLLWKVPGPEEVQGQGLPVKRGAGSGAEHG